MAYTVFNERRHCTDPLTGRDIPWYRDGGEWDCKVRSVVRLTLNGADQHQTRPIWTRTRHDAQRLCAIWSNIEATSPAAKAGHRYAHEIISL